MRARMAAYRSWANTSDRTARTEPARRSADSRFEQQVDPAGVLPPETRAQRAAAARSAYFVRLAWASARSRQLRRHNKKNKK
ncbi:hypothetical protein FPZ12_023885 [Amycolatopsis acidicola]|uniref:Uncharacterized protein n=2 Tax=Amycolatopsis acidicola TaxID=2596893 RepID=A0A5N0V0K7_9PSEU|nr:hypothetical protein FPZ12_023885 [Amycolatopsis acidicola]